jgi:hypothetical protein
MDNYKPLEWSLELMVMDAILAIADIPAEWPQERKLRQAHRILGKLYRDLVRAGYALPIILAERWEELLSAYYPAEHEDKPWTRIFG